MARSLVFSRIVKTFKSYSRGDTVWSFIFFLMCAVSLFGLIFSSPSVDYREAVVGRITYLNPLFVDFNEVDRDVSQLIFSGLMRYDPEQEAVVPDMADLTLDKDQLLYTFRLKDNLRWHDGEPLTVDDVYFTFHDVIQNPEFENPILRENFDGIAIVKNEDGTISFRLSKPNSFFITNMTTGILPKHLLDQIAVKDLKNTPFSKSPIGSGPYRIDGSLKTHPDGRTEVVLSRYNAFYRENSPIQHMNIVAYPTLELLMKDRRQYDALVKLTGTDIEKVRDDGNFTLVPFHLPQYTAVFMNMDSPILKTLSVRIALQKSVDKTALLPLLQDKEAVDTPLLELNQAEWIYQYSQTEAMGGLFAAGYKYDKENPDEKYRKDKEGNVLTLRLVARQFPEHSRQAQEMKILVDFLTQAWEGIGIKMEVESYEMAEYNDVLVNRDYDMVIAGQSLGYNLDTFAYWHSTQSGTGLNLSNYKSFAIDSFIEDVRDSFDLKQKQKSLVKLAKALADDVPAIFLYRPTYYYVTDQKVKNVDLENISFTSDRFAHMEKWGF